MFVAEIRREHFTQLLDELAEGADCVAFVIEGKAVSVVVQNLLDQLDSDKLRDNLSGEWPRRAKVKRGFWNYG
jgi:hypothetical protein